jgi:hypothetical protein
MSDAPKIVLQPFGDAGEVCEDDVCLLPPRVVGSDNPV